MEASGSTTRLSPALTQAGTRAVPQMNRRHSAIPTPRPLRSSPLAGPVLSSEDGTRVHLRSAASAPPSRSPSLLSLHTRADSSSSYSRRVVPTSHPALSTSLEDPASFRVESLSKREGKRRSVSQPVPVFDVLDPRSEDRGTHTGFAPPSSATPPPTRPGSRASFRESGANWLTFAPYDATPRFSRLGLGAPGVVMPVRKDTKTQKRPKSAGSGSVTSLGSVPSLNSSASSRPESPPPGTPKLVFTPPPPDEPEAYEKDEEQGIPKRKKHRWGKTKGEDVAVASVEREGTIKRLWRKLSRSGR
ncbi:hypothetical protein DFH07DRAFT_439962 [Mycena maculata]|uniref:Uncharacterized protein n=1 Tax=Mycena maculata TaxID=230809 RepID=A0AAD7NY74_9AGAR|nr:hypothetical protein DFH07DRAFT_439962 [Mycena maculata]